MSRSEELERRVVAQRLRNRRRALADVLVGLLGEGAPEPLADAGEVERLCAAIHESYGVAQEGEAIVRGSWRAEDAGELRDAFGRLARGLGRRGVWVLDLGWEPQAFASESDTVLGDPLGLAEVTGHHLAILDAGAPAGLSLARHTHHYGPEVKRFTWELEAWGEPWRSATAEALVGSGGGDAELGERIVVDPTVRNGNPVIRGTRITVTDVLEYLAAGMSQAEILEDFPDLVEEDIRSVLNFAVERERRLFSV